MLDRSSRIKGSLVGGAAGDALGYVVEFDSETDIKKRFGVQGIVRYEIDESRGKALISDDTQMTLFTACAVLLSNKEHNGSEIRGRLTKYAINSYMDWLYTQGFSEEGYKPGTWLSRVKEMHNKREPGRTCLLSLGKHEYGSRRNPMNGSKGCGGIMRVAPIGLYYTCNRLEGDLDYKYLMEETADIVAITHGHPLGYLPAVAFVHIIHEIMENKVISKEDLIEVSRTAIDMLYVVFCDEENRFLEEMKRINELAIKLATNSDSDSANIHRLGEGWVAEETYGIALYCCLKYFGDFSQTIIAAVNHNGDSDSTGSVAGNIMGAIVGYDGIDDCWKKDLELMDVILTIAEDCL